MAHPAAGDFHGGRLKTPERDTHFDIETTNGLGVHVVAAPESWRKATLIRAHTPAELCIFGSVWNFEYEGGAFEVHFYADGHFVCPDYNDGRSSWTMTEGNKLAINWGRYGQYDLVVDAATKTFQGSTRGNTSSWRKGNYMQEIPADAW